MIWTRAFHPPVETRNQSTMVGVAWVDENSITFWFCGEYYDMQCRETWEVEGGFIGKWA